MNNRVHSYLAVACCVAWSVSSWAGNVLYLGDLINGTTPQTELITLIESAGHTVTSELWSDYDDAAGGPDTSYFNSFDVLICGPLGPSQNFDANKTSWNGLAVPMLLTSAWHARSGYWDWTTGTAVDQNAVYPVTGFGGGTDPVWTGMDISGPVPLHQADLETALNTDALANGGVVVGANGSIKLVARWAAGAFGAGSGERILFPMGRKNEAGQLGAYNLTADGEAAFLNAIESLISEGTPPIADINISFQLTTATANALDAGNSPVTQGTVVNTSAETWNKITSGGSPASGSGIALLDANGDPSGATISFNCGYVRQSNGLVLNDKDDVMMDSWFGVKDAEYITVSGLPDNLVSNGYSVIVYGDSNVSGREMNYVVEGQTNTIYDTVMFSGDFDSLRVVFENLTNNTFTITGFTPDSARSAINGIQIVPGDAGVSNPLGINSFTVGQGYVSPGATNTLSWETFGADTFWIDGGIGDVTALTTNGNGSAQFVASSNTTSYTLTISNATESATQTVSFTVGPPLPPRPNLLIFLVDDYGVCDTSVPFIYDTNDNPVGYNFNTYYQTPNVEGFAASGMRFTTAYAQSVCSPTRCGILTGRNSIRHGVTDWVGSPDVTVPMWRSTGMTPNELTMPKQLQAAGYRTIHVGKGHWSDATVDVKSHGFDVNIAGGHWGSPNGGYTGYSTKLPEMTGHTEFLTQALAIEANEQLESAVNDGVPFFLNMCFYATHTPFTTNPNATGDYSNAVSANHTKFSTMVEGVDMAIGSIMQKLDQLGVAENTLIIFLGDNGSDSPALLAEGLPSGMFNDYPMRGRKASKYEGGVRVPFIVTWGATNSANPFQMDLPIASNSHEDDIVTSWDIPATLLDVVGLIPQGDYCEDSHSLLGYLRGESGTHRPQKVVLHYPHPHYRGRYFSWLREGNLKLIFNFETSTHELYDLEADPTESNNLAGAMPETTMSLARELARTVDGMWDETPPLFPPQDIIDAAPMGQNLISIPNSGALDLDGDGLADTAEDPNRNGLLDAGETDPADSDTDHDTTPDGAELEMGLNPLDSNQYFWLDMVSHSNSHYQLSWPSLPGNAFRLNASTTLTNWNILIETIPAASTSTTTVYEVISTEPTMFYRPELK